MLLLGALTLGACASPEGVMDESDDGNSPSTGGKSTGGMPGAGGTAGTDTGGTAGTDTGGTAGTGGTGGTGGTDTGGTAGTGGTDTGGTGGTGSTQTLCSGSVTLSDQLGTITDGSGPSNYVGHMDCDWNITVPGSTAILLDFTELDTEANYDFVKIYEGTDATGKLLGSYSGSNLPPRLVAMGESMFVAWASDALTNGQGFSADFAARTEPVEICGNGIDDDGDDQKDCADDDCERDEACTPVLCSGTVTRTAETGVIQDGSGASNYVGDMDCAWVINVSGSASISLDFTALDTEANLDFVKVYEGSDTGGKLLGTYSGSTIPPRIFATGEAMFVTWHSDALTVGQGFTANYTARTEPPEICGNGIDDDNDNQKDCADDDCAWDEACTPVLCSGTVNRTAPTGIIQDGSGASNYVSSMNCGWAVSVSGADSIQLDFSSFSTEGNFDYVRVYEGSDASGTLKGSFSGTTIPGPVVVNGTSMFVTFTSDSGGNGAGFEASYAAKF